MLLFRRRDERAQELKSLLLDLRVALEASQQMSTAAHDRLSNLGDRVDSLAMDVAKMAKEPGRVASGWKAFRLWIYALLVVTVAGLAIFIGTEAFNEFKPSDLGEGAISLWVDGSSDVSAAAITEAYTAWSDSVQYSITMPPSSTARKFYLVLDGPALLDNLYPNMTITEDDGFGDRKDTSDGLSVKTGQCNQYGDQTCEVVTGSIPRTAPNSIPHPSPATGCTADSPSEATPHVPGTIDVELSGFAATSERLDHFHTAIHMPYVSPGVLSNYHPTMAGVLPRILKPVPADTCRILSVDAETEVSAFSVQPGTTLRDKYEWSTNLSNIFSSQTPTPPWNANTTGAIIQSGDTQREGNIYIGVAGAAFALGVGYIPLAYEATGSWRRRRREERPASSRITSFLKRSTH